MLHTVSHNCTEESRDKGEAGDRLMDLVGESSGKKRKAAGKRCFVSSIELLWLGELIGRDWPCERLDQFRRSDSVLLFLDG